MPEVGWSKEHHAIAKAKGAHLFCVAVYGKYAKRGSLSYKGPCTAKTAKEIELFMYKLMKREKTL